MLEIVVRALKRFGAVIESLGEVAQRVLGRARAQGEADRAEHEFGGEWPFEEDDVGDADEGIGKREQLRPAFGPAPGHQQDWQLRPRRLGIQPSADSNTGARKTRSACVNRILATALASAQLTTSLHVNRRGRRGRKARSQRLPVNATSSRLSGRWKASSLVHSTSAKRRWRHRVCKARRCAATCSA